MQDARSWPFAQWAFNIAAGNGQHVDQSSVKQALDANVV